VLRGVLLCAFVLVLTALCAPSADANVGLPPGVTPDVTPPAGGGLVELSNGEYALYGPGGEEAQAMKLYSSSDEATLVRRSTALQVDSGVTGQDASSVEGSTSGDVEAVDAMHSELVGDGSEDAADGVVNDVTDGSRTLGVLPDLGEIAGALAGGLEVAGGAVAVVGIASGIDEVFGLPTLFNASPFEQSTSHGYVRVYQQGGEKYEGSVPCNSVVPGHSPAVWRANGDHCEMLSEQVSETLVPIEPECVERFGKHTCENLGGGPVEYGTVIGGVEATPGLTREPNAETLPNGDIAIFRDIEQEITDKGLPHTTATPENFSSPSTPTVPTPAPLAEPVPVRPLSSLPQELVEYVAGVEPSLGHGEGGFVPSPIAVNKLAEVLAENNPESALEDKELKELAKGCLESSANAGSSGSSDCEKLPIFASGSDVPSATSHDLKALLAHPEWGELDYESVAAKEAKMFEGSKVKRKWFNSVAPCSSPPPSESEQCDEYPFFATQQGGPLATPAPSLEYIDEEDNQEQGSKYGAFVTSCHLATRVHFLAVPLPPSLGIPTTRLCNE
jgi:hypothetical protein